jgi:membrane protein DedA with SNARE-associated domain
MASYLSTLVNVASAHLHYALSVVFLPALSEPIPIFGTFVPDSMLVLVISALATNTGANPWRHLVAACPDAIAGDGLSFWLGQQYGYNNPSAWRLNRYPQFITHSKKFTARYGAANVLLAPFTAVVRVLVPLVSGILNISRGSFSRQTYFSTLVWAPARVFPGMLLVMLLQFTGMSALHRALLVIAALVVTRRYLRAKWSRAFTIKRITAKNMHTPQHALSHNECAS